MKDRRMLFVIGFVLAMLALLTACGTPALQNRMSYQGRLTDAGDNPVTGNRDMTFRLFTADSGGSAIWTETQNNVPVNTGVFNVVLGVNTALDEANFHQPLYLEVVVAGQTMTPRQQLLGAPYAFSLVPGAVVKGYINNTETYSSTLTVANFGNGQALAAYSLTGPALYAGHPGGTALFADGAIASSSKSYMWISGNSLVKNLSSDTTRWDMDGTGSALIRRGAVGGDKIIYYPVTLPSVLYGQAVKLTKMTVFYKCQDGSKNYIDFTVLERQTAADAGVNIVVDQNNRTSNTATSYDLSLTTNNVLSSSQGGLGLRIGLKFVDDTNYVQIGSIRLELEHD
jgi:hypothetical protein